MNVRVGPQKKLSAEELMLLNCSVEDLGTLPGIFDLKIEIVTSPGCLSLTGWVLTGGIFLTS